MTKSSFEALSDDPTYRSLLGHLIGHEGPGSLLSELKRSDWANRLSAGCGAHLTGSGLFNIQISLTVRGMAEYQKVVHAVFQYIEQVDFITFGILFTTFSSQEPQNS